MGKASRRSKQHEDDILLGRLTEKMCLKCGKRAADSPAVWCKTCTLNGQRLRASRTQRTPAETEYWLAVYRELEDGSEATVVPSK